MGRFINLTLSTFVLIFFISLVEQKSQAATVVETQRIIVDPTKPIEGKPLSVTPAAPETHRPGDEALLPAPVAAARRKILDAAYSGDMDKLKAIIQASPSAPLFSVNEITDPIDYLKKQSGDGSGLEILAIITDVLEAGWAHVDAGKPRERYICPYYAVLPMDKLTPPQLVDVYKIVTSGDFEEMKASGTYSFYALGIGPDGTWHYFKPQD
jgi:hypothetical protein